MAATLDSSKTSESEKGLRDQLRPSLPLPALLQWLASEEMKSFLNDAGVLEDSSPYLDDVKSRINAQLAVELCIGVGHSSEMMSRLQGCLSTIMQCEGLRSRKKSNALPELHVPKVEVTFASRDAGEDKDISILEEKRQQHKITYASCKPAILSALAERKEDFEEQQILAFQNSLLALVKVDVDLISAYFRAACNSTEYIGDLIDELCTAQVLNYCDTNEHKKRFRLEYTASGKGGHNEVIKKEAQSQLGRLNDDLRHKISQGRVILLRKAIQQCSKAAEDLTKRAKQLGEDTIFIRKNTDALYDAATKMIELPVFFDLYKRFNGLFEVYQTVDAKKQQNQELAAEYSQLASELRKKLESWEKELKRVDDRKRQNEAEGGRKKKKAKAQAPA